MRHRLGPRPVPATLASAFHLVFWWSAGFSVVVLLSLWLAGVQPAPKASPDDALPSEPISAGPGGGQESAVPVGAAGESHLAPR